MPAATVVAVLDPGADLEFRPFHGGPDSAVVELRLQGRKERLCHRIVPADAGAAHRPGDAVRAGEVRDLR